MDAMISVPVSKRVVGLTGLKGCGKSTAAAALVRDFGFVEVCFADALKDACVAMFGWTREELDDPKGKEQTCEIWGVTRRKALQRVGTDLVRNTMPSAFPELNLEGSFWVEVMRHKIDRLIHAGVSRIVVSDVRFDDEAALVRDLGGIVVRIMRPGSVASTDLHASETEMAYIEVDGTAINRLNQSETMVADVCTIAKLVK